MMAQHGLFWPTPLNLRMARMQVNDAANKAQGLLPFIIPVVFRGAQRNEEEQEDSGGKCKTMH